jgi:integrase
VASIQTRELSDGETSYRVVYRHAGKQCADTFYDPAEAAEHLRLVEELGGPAARKIRDQREAAGPDALTLAAWCEEYVTGLEAVTDGTRHGYRATIRNRIAPSALGQTPLTAVKRPDVVAFLDAQDVKSGTKRNLQAFIAAALQAAMTTDRIPSNPARGIRIRQVEPTHDMAFLSPGELAILLAALPAYWVPLVATLAGTGLRWGEATALLVGDVDLDAQVPLLRVNKAWKKGPGAQPVIGPPKTAAGSRTIGLGPEVVEVLRPLIEGRPQDAYVFTSPAGGPVNHSRFGRKVWRPALARLKDAGALTKPVRIHDLRHTHASHLVAAGIPLNIVQKRLGHSSITQTVDRYSHLAPDYLAVAASASSYGLAQALPAIEG